METRSRISRSVSSQRIGILLDEWRDGGVPVFIERLERALAHKGYETFLFLTHPYPKRDMTSKNLYLDLKSRLGSRCISLDYKSYPAAWRKLHFRNVIMAREVTCLLVNHFSLHFDDLAAISEELPLISIAHTDFDYYYTEYLHTMDFTGAHVAVSKRIYEKTLNLTAPSRFRNVHYIPYGIENSSELFHPEPEGSFKVIYCARLDFVQKRCQDLVPIWKEFIAQGGQGQLVILGSGRGADLLKSAFLGEIESGQVQMHHHVTPQRVLKEMAESDVLVNLSNFEGLPQVILEGASLGLYPLLSDIESGHREIVEKLGIGTLCHVGDAQAFARELLRLWTNMVMLRKQRRKIREAGLRHYSMDECSQRYHRLIQDVGRPAQTSFRPIPQKKTIFEHLKRFFLLAKYRRHFIP